MPQFAANLSLLYKDLPFLERFAAAARSGFKTVEFQFPYDFPAQEIARCLSDAKLGLAMHNLPAGDWAAGDRGMAVDPQRVDEFRRGVALGIEYARVLGTPQMNCLAGIAPAGLDAQQGRASLVANLRWAAGELQRHGIGLLLEPINTFDIPGFFVNRTAQALQILDDVGADTLRLQYDIYHAQRMEGELAGNLRLHLPRIGHIQLADNPGRNEPGTGEINYRFLFQLLDQLGYKGCIGCEYIPRDTTAAGTDAGLGWLAAHGQSL